MADLPSLPSTIWLGREDCRALAWRDRQPAPTPRHNGLCICCYGPLENESAACSDECDQIWWRVVPTTDGELWLPDDRAERAALLSGLDALAHA